MTLDACAAWLAQTHEVFPFLNFGLCLGVLGLCYAIYVSVTLCLATLVKILALAQAEAAGQAEKRGSP